MKLKTSLATASAALLIAGAGWAQSNDDSATTPQASEITADAANQMTCSEFLALDLVRQNDAVAQLAPELANPSAETGTGGGMTTDDTVAAGSSTPIPGTNVTGSGTASGTATDMASGGADANSGLSATGGTGSGTDTTDMASGTSTDAGSGSGTMATGSTGTDMAAGTATDQGGMTGGTTSTEGTLDTASNMDATGDTTATGTAGSTMAGSTDTAEADPFSDSDAVMGADTTPMLVTYVTEVCNADATASLSDAVGSAPAGQSGSDATQPMGDTQTN